MILRWVILRVKHSWLLIWRCSNIVLTYLIVCFLTLCRLLSTLLLSDRPLNIVMVYCHRLIRWLHILGWFYDNRRSLKCMIYTKSICWSCWLWFMSSHCLFWALFLQNGVFWWVLLKEHQVFVLLRRVEVIRVFFHLVLTFNHWRLNWWDRDRPFVAHGVVWMVVGLLRLSCL